MATPRLHGSKLAGSPRDALPAGARWCMSCPTLYEACQCHGPGALGPGPWALASFSLRGAMRSEWLQEVLTVLPSGQAQSTGECVHTQLEGEGHSVGSRGSGVLSPRCCRAHGLCRPQTRGRAEPAARGSAAPLPRFLLHTEPQMTRGCQKAWFHKEVMSSKGM